MAATLPELEQAMFNAHKAGDGNAARKLAAVIKRERDRLSKRPETEVWMDELMVAEEGGPIIGETVIPEPEPTLGQQIKGGLETGATMITGMTGGLVGQIEGSVEGILREIASGEFGAYEAADRIEKLAMERAQALTYTPKTEQGIEMTKDVGEALAPLAAIPPLAETQLIASTAGRASQQAQHAARQTARQAAPQVKQTAQEISRRVRERLPTRQQAPGDQSAGAAQVPMSAQRRAQAEKLGFVGDKALTKGQAERTFEAQRFERETAKMPEEGALIRERMENQNAQFEKVLDDFVDKTGSKVTSLEDVGITLDKALKKQYENEKTKVNVLYKNADKAGELEAPASVPALVRHINESTSLEGTVGNLAAVRRELVRMGAAVEQDGVLVPRPVTLRQGELIRTFINDATDSSSPREVRQAAIMKKAYDVDTSELGGGLYKKARAARAKLARDFENASLVDSLLSTKRGASDRKIALNKVLEKVILSDATSKQQMRTVSRLIKKTPEGQQAWRELQGATLRHIQDQMTKGVTTNQRGDRVVSAAQLDRVLTKLDQSGKLDFIFGKKGAEQLRTINDVAKTVLTAPPGTVNTSNTAAVLAGLMDVALTGSTGVPAPIATSFKLLTGQIKDAKLKARVKQTLGEN